MGIKPNEEYDCQYCHGTGYDALDGGQCEYCKGAGSKEDHDDD